VRQFLRRVRGAVGMGVVWALVWAPIAVVIGTTIVDPHDTMDEMWPMVGALPGFLGGVTFSVVLATAARRRRLEELSIGRVAAWGALAGFVVGSLPFFLGTPTASVPLWELFSIVAGSITVMSAGSAAASLAIARRGRTKATLVGGDGQPTGRLGSARTP
jgi:hypothetical protein